jgi:hypothetical protein
MAALGEALAWAITRGCTAALGVATKETEWLLERQCANCMDEFRGP